MYGMELPPIGERITMLDGAAQVIKALWEHPDGVSLDAPPYRLTDAVCDPAPITPGGPPIWLGTQGLKRGLRIVAERADGWNQTGDPSTFIGKRDALLRHCEAVGRDPAEIEMTLGIKATIRDTEAEADRVWKAAMEFNRTPMSNVEDDDTFWNGTADQLAEKLAPYVELGFRTVISEQPAPYDVETFERLIGEVGPKVAALTG